jgi:hypothetical protein
MSSTKAPKPVTLEVLQLAGSPSFSLIRRHGEAWRVLAAFDTREQADAAKAALEAGRVS